MYLDYSTNDRIFRLVYNSSESKNFLTIRSIERRNREWNPKLIEYRLHSNHIHDSMDEWKTKFDWSVAKRMHTSMQWLKHPIVKQMNLEIKWQTFETILFQFWSNIIFYFNFNVRLDWIYGPNVGEWSKLIGLSNQIKIIYFSYCFVKKQFPFGL